MKKACLILLVLAGALHARPQVDTTEGHKPTVAPAPLVYRATLKPEKPLTQDAGRLVADTEGGEVLYALPAATRLKPVQVVLAGQVETGEIEVAVVDEHGVVLQSGSPHTASVLDRLSLTVPKTGASLRLTVRPHTRFLLRELTVTAH